MFFQTDSIDSSTTSSSDTGESNSHKIRHRMRPRPHFKGGAGGQQRSSGRKLSTPGGSATTNYSMTCLERLIRTHPIWFLPKLNRDEASEFLTGKGSGVRITTVLVIIVSPQYVAISSSSYVVKWPLRRYCPPIPRNDDCIHQYIPGT